MTEDQKKQVKLDVVQSYADARDDISCLNSVAENYIYEIEKCHRALCKLIGRDSIFDDDGKKPEQDKWPTFKDLYDLTQDITRIKTTISECEVKLRKWNVID